MKDTVIRVFFVHLISLSMLYQCELDKSVSHVLILCAGWLAGVGTG